jgi:hypothetical protein
MKILEIRLFGDSFEIPVLNDLKSKSKFDESERFLLAQ